MSKKVRHILGISGGKDSAALAVYLHKKIPQMEYFFCDTHKELSETYDFLDKLRARLGIKITYLSSERGFDHWLDVYGGYLPSPRMRWCTRMLKIIPLEQFVGNDDVISYVGIREDENRDGYISTKPNIKAIYPFRTRGDKNKQSENDEEVIKYLESEDIYLDFNGYNKPDIERETLEELIKRKDKVIANHEKAIEQKLKTNVNRTLFDVLSAVLDEEDDREPCLVCHL